MKLMSRLKTGKTKRKLYRDGVEEEITGAICVSKTSEDHIIESYKLSNGKRRHFATLAGTHWCAHGDTVASAIADALWKDPAQRPSMESLRAEIQAIGKGHKFTLNEFRLLTGACLTGCRDALARVGRDESPLIANDIRNLVSREWGDKLLSVLGWEEGRI